MREEGGWFSKLMLRPVFWDLVTDTSHLPSSLPSWSPLPAGTLDSIFHLFDLPQPSSSLAVYHSFFTSLCLWAPIPLFPLDG